MSEKLSVWGVVIMEEKILQEYICGYGLGKQGFIHKAPRWVCEHRSGAIERDWFAEQLCSVRYGG